MRNPDIKNAEWKPAINKEWIKKLDRIQNLLGDPRLIDAIAELGRRKLVALKQVAEMKALELELKNKIKDLKK